MAEIGDKAFTTEMINLIKDAVMKELGTNAFVNRYLATVTAVNSTTSEVSVKLSGYDVASDSFRFRGLQMPAVNDQVIACIDGQDRWIESVVRPTTSTPYIQISSGSLVGAGAPTGAILGYPFATPPSGWLVCDGTSKNYNDYPALGALYGAAPGGTFTLPNMLDRFMAGLSAAGSLSNTTGTLSPNSAIASHSHSTSHSHTFTGDSHSHNIGHDHADTFSANAATEATHTHSVNPASVTSDFTASVNSRFFPASGTLVSVPSGTHTHAVDVLSTLSGAGATHDHAITVSGGVTALGTTNVTATATGTNGTDTTATGGSSWSAAASTPKATLLNFIIKT